MQAGSIDLTTKSRVKEFGRTRRLEKDSRMFLVGSGEGEMLEMLGTFVGEEIDGSHFSSMADAFEVEHVDDLLALFEQVPKYLGSIRLQGVLIDADPKTNAARSAVLVAPSASKSPTTSTRPAACCSSRRAASRVPSSADTGSSADSAVASCASSVT